MRANKWLRRSSMAWSSLLRARASLSAVFGGIECPEKAGGTVKSAPVDGCSSTGTPSGNGNFAVKASRSGGGKSCCAAWRLF